MHYINAYTSHKKTQYKQKKKMDIKYSSKAGNMKTCDIFC